MVSTAQHSTAHYYKHLLLIPFLLFISLWLSACNVDGDANGWDASTANHVPVAQTASVDVATGSTAQITLLATDADGDTLTFRIVTEPAHGTLRLGQGNVYIYTPNSSYEGDDSFTFVANDGKVDSAAAKVGVKVYTADSGTSGGTNGGGTGGSKVSISGTAFDAAIVGGTVTLKDMNGKVLGTTTTDANGKFTIQVAADSVKNGYVLSVTGGTMDGVAFTGVLTATYSVTDAKDAANLTVVTTLIDAVAADMAGVTQLEKRNAAIKKLANIGMLKADNWNQLTSDYFELQALAWRIQDAGGVQAWLALIKTDLADGELSLAESRSMFPKAYGGLESATAVQGVSVFPGEKSTAVVTVQPVDKLGTAVVKLLNAPPWVSVTGNTITAAPPISEAPAIHTVNIEVSPDGVLAGRKAQVEVSVLKQIVLLHGFLGATGGKIENEWKDIAISAPAGVLSQEYEITYSFGIDSNSAVIGKFEFTPEIIPDDIGKFHIVEPSATIIRENYLSGSINSLSQRRTAARVANTGVADSSSYQVGNTAFPTSVPVECANEWLKTGRDGSGGETAPADSFEFNPTGILQASTGWFSTDEPGLDGAPGFSARNWSSYPRILPSALEHFTSRKKSQCTSMLLSHKAGKVDPITNKQPILLVHGYAMGQMGDIDSYFVKFPKLLADAGYPVYTFVWNTNQRFEDAAHDLGLAVYNITEREMRQVHIVAHSYGGLLTRTLLQGFARDIGNKVSVGLNHAFMEKHIASVTTVGTPHSGVFGSKTQSPFDKSLTFYNGRHTLVGAAIEVCASLTCHEAGEEWNRLGKRPILIGIDPITKLPLYTYMKTYDKKTYFGVEDETGKIPFSLAKTSYPNVPTQVLMGIIPDEQVCNDLDGDDLCEMRYSAHPDSIGDGLISLAGQRFYPGNHKKPLMMENVEEHLLGFDASALVKWQDSYMDYINDSGSWSRGEFQVNYSFSKDAISSAESFDSSFETVTYNHRGSTFDNKRISSGGMSSLTKNIERITPMFTEVGLQNCESPDKCNHATWYYVKNMLEKHKSQSVDVPLKTTIKGTTVPCWWSSSPAKCFSGETPKARVAARTAEAATTTSESAGFTVNIYTDSELLGSTITDANGDFSLDIEFDAKRNYVVEAFPPKSTDAATLSRVAVAVLTGAEIEKANYVLPDILISSKAFQQGMLNIQVKDKNTGATLLGYNLTAMNNVNNIIVDNKPVNSADDSSLKLPMNSYRMTVTKVGYAPSSTQCWVLANGTRNCELTIALAKDTDGDGMPDAWELQYGLDPNNPADAAQDKDGDSVSNLDEFKGNSDPTDKNSIPGGKLTAPTVTATPSDKQVTLSWEAIQGATGGYAYCYSKVSADCATYNTSWIDESGTTVTITGLDNDSLYHFRVVAKDANGKASAVSEERSATPNPITSTTSCGKPIKSILFKDSFDGASIDTTKWDVDQTGGSAILLDGKLSVLGNGSNPNRFPVIQTKTNPFPASGNFSFYCKAQYTHLGSSGTGACVAVERMLENLGSVWWTYDSGNGMGVWAGLGGVPLTVSSSGTNIFSYSTGETLDSHEYEVCVVGSQVTGYRDGQEVAKGTLPANWARPTKILLGNPVMGGDDWSTFDTDAVEVRQLEDSVTPPTDGLVAHWSFDDCNATDSSSAKNSGVLVASPGCVTGVLGKAIDLNTTNYAEIPDSDSLDVSNAFTLSVWFNGRSLGSQSSEQRPFRLIDKVTAGYGDGYLLDAWAGGIRFVSGGDGAIAYTPVSENTFHHVAGIFSQGKASIYLDGKLVISTTTVTTDTPINTFPVRIGASQGSGAIQADNFNGLIDDVRIYNRTLSETEIQTLYQQGGGSVDNTGWTLNPTTGHYYKTLDNCGNWEQCETAAQAAGAHLIVLDDQAENTWMSNTFPYTHQL
ncbi:Fibronectin type III domain-containing protein [Thiothrix caldifontis]|uniref:Fibronectin type III domain-containing protein n=1 Tax=Thiothrix caldifontis TaxID=525918 RepID=A0A1H4FPU5_9GAMM|nr:LamG-like jellyroll fold domain-containing protein [Thiothrix caldifontis]SEA99161.1 Fibronectin type III domain-containing protein [Thiothrix caldifontis]